MSVGSVSFTIVAAALVIGAVAGAAIGRVVAARTRMVLGLIVGAVGAVVWIYLLATGVVRADFVNQVLTPVAAVLCGLMAGFFFAFSIAVMMALSEQPSSAGMATMQAINVDVFNPVFGAAYTLTPIACVLVMIAALFHWSTPRALAVLMGGAIYVIGTAGVTAMCNVPRNDALAALSSTAPGAAELWSRYLREWTAWNHVRAMAAFVASSLLTVALLNT